MQERIFKFVIARNEDEIEMLKDRVVVCREWIQKNLL